MSNFSTGQDILRDVLWKAGEKSDGTSEYDAKARDYVQQVYWDVYSWAPWPWAKKYPPGVFQTVAKVTGTASPVNGSASVTLGAVIATSMAGRKFQIDGQGIPYRILAHTAGTDVLTLDAVYTEPNATAVSFTIFQDEYQLAPASSIVIKPFSFWYRNNPQTPMNFISEAEMNVRPYPVGTSAGITKIAMITNDRVRIQPWTESIATIEYDYAEQQTVLTLDGVAGTDTPVIPQDDRIVLAYMAAAMILKDKNQDADVNYYFTLAIGKINRMLDKYLTPRRTRVWVNSSRSLGART